MIKPTAKSRTTLPSQPPDQPPLLQAERCSDAGACALNSETRCLLPGGRYRNDRKLSHLGLQVAAHRRIEVRK